jgi:hypothetical protein
MPFGVRAEQIDPAAAPAVRKVGDERLGSEYADFSLGA